MENSKKNKNNGFYISIIVTFLSLLTSLIYLLTYKGSDYMSWTSFLLLVTVVLVNIILLVKNKLSLSPWISGLIILIAYMFYFYGKYLYISVVLVGIDLSSFDSKFIINTTLYTILFLLSIINIYLPQRSNEGSIKTNVKVLIGSLALLLAILCLSSVIIKDNFGAINAFVGAKTFKVVEKQESRIDTQYYKSKFENLDKLITSGIEIGKQAEAEGAVLLKNENNALPLKSGSRNITLFGITSVDPIYGGTGSGAVNTATAPTFKKAMELSGFNINSTVWNFYKDSQEEYGREELRSASSWFSRGYTINEVPWSNVKKSTEDSYAQYGDAAIFIIGRVGGEGADTARTGFEDSTATDGNYLKLSTDEISALKGLSELKGDKFKKIIVLINSANQVETDFLNNPEYKIDAALWIGSVGQVGLYSVADILSGAVVPSGRLSDMFWNNHNDNPVHGNFGAYTYENSEDFGISDNRFSSYVVYQEGIYLGYRYAETRYEDVVLNRNGAGSFNYDKVVTYPFGFGLSYTDFSYSNYSVVKNGKTYTASVKVKNEGKEFSGKEVVQFYIQKPYTQYDIENGIEKASVELVQFAKTNILAPGESEILSVDIEEKYFASYDSFNAKTYIIDKGEYYISVGKNAHDALNNILSYKGFSKNNGMSTNGNNLLVKMFNMEFDNITYSTSDATGKEISNLFDFADINRLKYAGNNKVNYLSRNNWEETTFTTLIQKNVNISLNEQMVNNLISQTLPLEKDNVTYPNYGVKNSLNLINMKMDKNGNPISFNDPLWDTFMDQLSWDETTYLLSTGLRKTGGISSIAKPETLDHNGPSGLTQPYSQGSLGLATKTNDPLKESQPMCYPSNGIIASTFNQELAYNIGEMIGEDALWTGYSGLYGTGANMHRSPYEGRAFEYYSEDPILTGLIVSNESEGVQSKGCYVYLKHFALNEQENNRTGIATWVNEQTLREIYLRPFEISISEGGAKNVMQAFNRIGLIQASNSYNLMEKFLRDESRTTRFYCYRLLWFIWSCFGKIKYCSKMVQIYQMEILTHQLLLMNTKQVMVD